MSIVTTKDLKNIFCKAGAFSRTCFVITGAQIFMTLFVAVLWLYQAQKKPAIPHNYWGCKLRYGRFLQCFMSVPCGFPVSGHPAKGK